MKKIIGCIIGGLIALSAQAGQGWCGYKDFFHFSDTTRPLLFISNTSTNGNVYVQPIGPRSFEIRDTEKCNAGRAHILIADYENSNFGCVVDIEDGPFINTPRVQASCNGVSYLGTTYDGIGSYSYTLNFR